MGSLLMSRKSICSSRQSYIHRVFGGNPTMSLFNKTELTNIFTIFNKHRKPITIFNKHKKPITLKIWFLICYFEINSKMD